MTEFAAIDGYTPWRRYFTLLICLYLSPKATRGHVDYTKGYLAWILTAVLVIATTVSALKILGQGTLCIQGQKKI